VKHQIKLVTINLIVGIALGHLGWTISHKFFNTALTPSALIYLFTSFLISAFTIGNAYRYSQRYEEEKASKKQGGLWFV
jgi:hypothetical protein